MLYGTPPRGTHRSVDDGGFAVLIKSVGVDALIKTFDPDGRHRQAPPAGTAHPRARLQRPPGETHPRPRPQWPPVEPERAAHWLTRGLATLIVLGILGMIGFVAFSDSRRDDPAGTSDAPAVADPLDSRAGDGVPLSALEVFPDQQRVAVPGTAYRIALVNSDADCRGATTGTLGLLLDQFGCSQVVRAGMTAPAGGYEVTAGIFNLADAAGAAQVSGRLRQLVETDDGGFASMSPAPPGADPSAPPSGQVGWRAQGHYLLFCVITRPDGQPVTDDDPNAVQITADLVDGYLSDSILSHRGSRA